MSKVRKVRKLSNGSEKSRNTKVLQSFVSYCTKHKEQRFWQALRNWSNFPYVYVFDGVDYLDTFYWENKNV